MKRIITVLLVMMVLIGGMIGVVNTSGDADDMSREIKPTSDAQSKSYISHDPIRIDGNDDFTEANGVTGGNGTESNPYIIEGWDIDASTGNGIKITSTSMYFIIRNCVIHDGWTGDWTTSHYGIYFYSVQNSKIDNVTSYNNSHGIFFSYSSNNSISSNQFYNNDFGICFYAFSNNNTVILNQIHNNYYDGFDLCDSSNNSITSNQIYNNSYRGIQLHRSSNNEVHYNNVYNNTGYGVDVSDCTVNATYNWWGSADGPFGAGANSVSSNVAYVPWLTAPYHPINHAPIVNSITANPIGVTTGGTVAITVDASDEDAGDILTYHYTCTGGTISGTGSSVTWTAPSTADNYTITVYVNDGIVNSNSKSVSVTVTSPEKEKPKGFIPGFETFLLLIVLTGYATVGIRRRKKVQPPEKPAG